MARRFLLRRHWRCFAFACGKNQSREGRENMPRMRINCVRGGRIQNNMPQRERATPQAIEEWRARIMGCARGCRM
eukprot:8483256-Pyramimonas_sp.AAC.2